MVTYALKQKICTAQFSRMSVYNLNPCFRKTYFYNSNVIVKLNKNMFIFFQSEKYL